MGGFSLGSIWLQVVPSFDGVQTAAATEGAKAGAAWARGFNSTAGTASAQRAQQAEATGEQIGQAEGRGRTKALNAAQAREEAARRRHAERMEHQQKRHQDSMTQQAARSQAAREALEERHQNSLRETKARHQSAMEMQEKRHRDALERDQIRHHAKEELLETAHQRRMEAKREQDRRRAQRAAVARAEAERRALERLLGARFQTDPRHFRRAMEAAIAGAIAEIPDIEVDVELDTAKATQEAMDLRRRLNLLLEHIRIDPEVRSSGAIAEFTRLRAMMEALAQNDVEIDARVNAAGALAQLTTLTTATRRLDRANDRLARSYRRVGTSAGGAANAMRLTNLTLLGLVTLGPVLVPVIMSIAGAIAAIGTASIGAIAGVGAMVLGLGGIGGALQAMRAQEIEDLYSPPETSASDQRGRQQRRTNRQQRSSDRQIRNARRGIERAERGVADARAGVTAAEEGVVEARARATQMLADATRAVEDAERNLERAQRNTRRAQEQLTRARRDARREIEDMNNALISGHLAEQDALYDLEEARYSLHRIMQDGSATAREQARAQLAYDIQVQRFRELQLQNERMREDAPAIQAAGVEGSDQVISAKEAIEDATYREEEAERSLAQARREAAQAPVEAARLIADAQQRVADAHDNVRYALESLDDAHENLQWALEAQAEAQQDAALAAEQAEIGIEKLSAAQRNLAEAMDKLSPAGRNFVRWLYGLRPMLQELRWAAQEALLPGLQDGMQAVIDAYYPSVLEFVTDVSEKVGGIFSRLGEFLAQPEVVEFFETMMEYALIFIDQWADIFGNLGIGWMGVMEQLMPFTEAFGEAMIELSAIFAEWANSPEGQEMMRSFFEYLQNMSPKMLELFTLAFEVLVNLFIGLAPYTEMLVDFLIGILEWLSELDPDTLGKFVIALGGLILLLQVFSAAGSIIFGVQNLVGSFRGLFSALRPVFGLLTSKVGLVVLAITGLVLALIWLYNNSETFREFINAIGRGFLWVWEEILKPVGMAIAETFMWIWNNVLYPVFTWFMGIVESAGNGFSWFYENVVKPVWDGIKLVFSIGWTFLEIIFKSFQVALELLGRVWNWLYNDVIRPAWDKISGKTSDAWNKHIKPILDTFSNFLDRHVRPKFDAAVEKLGEAWNRLREFFAKPIVWVVDTVINKGIIDNVNKVFDVFDVDPVSHVRVPQSIRNAARGRFAAGGVLDGYSPGVDDATFYSPKHGYLHLSGGEGIAVPELVAAIGRENFLALNHAARAGGISGARKAVQGGTGGTGGQHFALGGIWDTIWQAGSSVASTVGRWAGNIASFIANPIKTLKDLVGEFFTNFTGEGAMAKFVRAMPGKIIDRIGSGLLSMIGPSETVGKGGGGALFSGSAGGKGDWIRPTRGPLTSAYGSRWGAFHAGVDIAGNHPVFAASDGVVTATGPRILAGRTGHGIILSHGDNIFTYYGHNPVGGITVRPGQRVAKGQRIGHQGATGNVTGIHLHFETHRGLGNTVDPESFMRARGVLLRDQGGEIPVGLSTVLNATGRPEYALPEDELRRLVRGANGGAGDVYDVDIHHPGASAAEIISALNFEVRHQRKGGVYQR